MKREKTEGKNVLAKDEEAFKPELIRVMRREGSAEKGEDRGQTWNKWGKMVSTNPWWRGGSRDFGTDGRARPE